MAATAIQQPGLARAAHLRHRPPRGPRGDADRRHHRHLPLRRGPPRFAARDVDRRRRRGRSSASASESRSRSLDANLPQRQQEQLETLIALVAVGGGHLHDRLDAPPRPQPARRSAGAPSRARSRAAPAGRSSAMAFFAVIREGLETAVFLARRVPAVGAPGADRQRGDPRHRRRGRARARDLPRRRADQPRSLLPRHGRRARPRRRRAPRLGIALRPRGGLDREPPGPGRRSDAGSSSPARSARRSSPACSACSRS